MASKKSPKRTSKKASPKNEREDRGSPVAVLVNKPGTGKTAGVRNDVYADVVNEIVSLSENESLAKKVDNGPLSEARGNDTWRLHAQLTAVDQLNANLDAQATSVKAALSQVDSHLFTKVQQSRDAVQTSVQESSSEIQSSISTFQATVKDSFAKLAKATAGSEENIRAQTDSFGKAMESLLATLQHDVNRKITEFRDESTRQIDKRFNQGDVAFAAVRADQEVIKALLTDIIKDRMGRPEPRSR